MARRPPAQDQTGQKHIYELETDLKLFGKTNPYEAVEKVEPDTGDRIWLAKINRQPPPRLGAVLGDTVHNLRSALDHLAHALVLSNNGTPHESLAYPISDTAQKFEASLGNIKAAGKEAVDLVRATKAYKGGDGEAFWAIRELDNGDKHRTLITIETAHRSVGIDFGAFLRAEAPPEFGEIPSLELWLKETGPPKALKGDEVLYRIPANSPGSEHHPNPNFRFQISLGEPKGFEGRSVLEAAVEFRDAVKAVVESFATLLSSR